MCFRGASYEGQIMVGRFDKAMQITARDGGQSSLLELKVVQGLQRLD